MWDVKLCCVWLLVSLLSCSLLVLLEALMLVSDAQTVQNKAWLGSNGERSAAETTANAAN